MPRRPRIHYFGAIYHVIVRGNNEKEVFHDDQDYRKYLSLLKEYTACNMYFVLAYALMNTHVHIMVEVRDRSLSELMKIVQQRYTQYYNKKYNTFGHVFQGRYKAFIVAENQYLMILFRYIHRNPIKAGLENSPGSDYPWTGHYELIQNKHLILAKDRMLSYFDVAKEKAVKEYIQFIHQDTEDVIQPEFYINPEKLVQKSDNDQVSQLMITFEQLLSVVSSELNVTVGEIELSTKRRELLLAKRVIIFIARNYLNVSGAELAKRLNVTEETVSRSYQKILHHKDMEASGIIDRVLRKTQKVKPDPDAR